MIVVAMPQMAMRADRGLRPSLPKRPEVVLFAVDKTCDNDADYFAIPLGVRAVGVKGDADNIAAHLYREKPGDKRVLNGERLENTQYRRRACDCHGLFSYLLGALPENADRTIGPTLTFAQVSILAKLRHGIVCSPARLVDHSQPEAAA